MPKNLLDSSYLKGRGAQIHTSNRFLKYQVLAEHIEGLDEPLIGDEKTEVYMDYPKTLVNKITSPDVGMMSSANPYQGCEHGCVYCYARTTHNYYGFSAGLDFERKIMVKPNAAQLLRKHFNHPKYAVECISFSGNTDCYQPLERTYKITRSLLQTCLEYKNPVGIITKNSLLLRDLDILTELAQLNLLRVMISVTSLREELRSSMEPRTATSKKRLQVIETLAQNNVPVGVMVAPIIPGLNSDEIPDIIKAAADCGAATAGYTIVRLNGEIANIFRDWLYKNKPDAADKIWNHIEACHGGKVNDSRPGIRMRGEGKIAESIRQLFKLSVKRHLSGRSMPPQNFTLFKRPPLNGQTELF